MKLHSTTTTVRLIRLCVVVFAAAAVVLLALPARSHAAVTLVAPAQGVQLPWVQLRPPIAFDIAKEEKPKWVLIATDPEMTKTVRYCRQFGAQWVTGAYHWACDQWAVGTDPNGFDMLKPLVGGTQVYYWQVIYTQPTVCKDVHGNVIDCSNPTRATFCKDADDKVIDCPELKSDVRAFTIEPMPVIEDISTISDRIFGTVVGDGTNLNLGHAAFVNSGVKVKTITSARVKTTRFQIGVTFTGGVDLLHSYIRLTSKAGTRYIKLTPKSTGAAVGTWSLSQREWKLAKRTYRYQAFLVSLKNKAKVRSAVHVIVIQRKKTHPAYTRV